MTHRFPHDFWADRDLDLHPGYRFDASLPRGLGGNRPYGFSRGIDWESLAGVNPQEELMRHFIDETVLDDIDLEDEPLDEGPHGCLTEELHPLGASTGLFIPEKYEPNYPYPLILWFHDAGGDESDLLSLMPEVSERNYFGLSLRGPVPRGAIAATGFDWPKDADAVALLEQQIYHTVCEVRRNFHIHSERVFLAGQGRGADIALRLLLNRPDWFAGAFALGGEMPAFDPQQSLHSELRERPVFLTTSAGEVPEQNLRLWRAAGLRITALPEDDHPGLSTVRLKQLNHWVMETICTPV